jgi:hypothetical protein
VSPVTIGIIVHFRFHISCISIHKLLYFNFFSASFYYYYYYYYLIFLKFLLTPLLPYQEKFNLGLSEEALLHLMSQNRSNAAVIYHF